MGESINIREYINMFKKRKYIIAMVILLSIAAGIFLSYRKNQSYVPVYQSSTRIRVNTAKNNPAAGFSPQTTSMNQGIVSSYLNLSKSKNTLNEIINTLLLDMTPEALSSKIQLTPDESNTEFVNITVTDTDPYRATIIANTVPLAFNNELIKTIKLDCIEVIDVALEPQIPLPYTKSNMAPKMAIIGVVLSIFVVLLLEFLNNKIVTPSDVEEYWDIPLLGVIPYEKPTKHSKSKKDKNENKEENKEVEKMEVD